MKTKTDESQEKQWNEQFVTLETAKLLKENGFDWPTYMAYDNFGIEGKIYDSFGYHNHNKHDDLISCPSQSVAMKWLREVKHIFIGVEPRLGQYDFYWVSGTVYTVKQERSYYGLREMEDKYSSHAICDAHTYENAVERAIKYSLDNIERLKIYL